MNEPTTPATGRAAPRRWLDGSLSGPLGGSPARGVDLSVHERLDETLRNEARLRLLVSEQIQKDKRAQAALAEQADALAARDATISMLQSELKAAKKSKQRAEDDLAQLSLDFINGQTAVVQIREEHNDEVAELKKSMAAIQNENNALADEVRALKQALRERPEADTPAQQMEKLQQEMLVKELRMLLRQAQQRGDALAERNAGLVDENESYQRLLVENTITGQLPEAAEGEPAEDADALRRELLALRDQYALLRRAHERLVARLLENRAFAKSVEEALSTTTVQAFRVRAAPRAPEAPPARPAELVTTVHSPTLKSHSPQLTASQWTSRIFSAGSRLSIASSHDTESQAVLTSSGSDVSSEPSEFPAPKPLPLVDAGVHRAESITGMRRLRLG